MALSFTMRAVACQRPASPSYVTSTACMRSARDTLAVLRASLRCIAPRVGMSKTHTSATRIVSRVVSTVVPA